MKNYSLILLKELKLSKHNTDLIVPINYDETVAGITRLTKFVREIEEEIFDIKKIDKLSIRNLDIKLVMYKEAKKSLMSDLEFLRKLFSTKQQLDGDMLIIVRSLMSLDNKIRRKFKDALIGVIKNKNKVNNENIDDNFLNN